MNLPEVEKELSELNPSEVEKELSKLELDAEKRQEEEPKPTFDAFIGHWSTLCLFWWDTGKWVRDIGQLSGSVDITMENASKLAYKVDHSLRLPRYDDPMGCFKRVLGVVCLTQDLPGMKIEGPNCFVLTQCQGHLVLKYTVEDELLFVEYLGLGDRFKEVFIKGWQLDDLPEDVDSKLARLPVKLFGKYKKDYAKKFDMEMKIFEFSLTFNDEEHEIKQGPSAMKINVFGTEYRASGDRHNCTRIDFADLEEDGDYKDNIISLYDKQLLQIVYNSVDGETEITSYVKLC